jgi:hypothetical protein
MIAHRWLGRPDVTNLQLEAPPEALSDSFGSSGCRFLPVRLAVGLSPTQLQGDLIQKKWFAVHDISRTFYLDQP